MIDLTITISNLDRIAAALDRLAQIESAARFRFQLNLGEISHMNYKADRPDFDFRVQIAATDSEGDPIPDAPIPAGHTLTVASDNEAAFRVLQDSADPRLIHAHVGSPNPDGTAAQANVVANLFDPANNLIATGSAQVVVTVGDPAAISNITLNLPE